VTKIKIIIESLSLDVALAALCGLLFAAEIVQQPMPWWWYVALLAGIWVVYSLDHLTDAWFLPDRTNNPRHLFYQQNKKILIVVLVFIGLIAAVLMIAFANYRLLVAGIILVLISALHILLVSTPQLKNRWFVQKEAMVALIYTLGIWFGPLVQKAQTPDWKVGLIMLAFAITAWLESTLIALLEIELDKQQQTRSMASNLGEKNTIRLLLFAGLIQLLFVLIMFAFESTHTAAWLIILAMNLALALLFYYRKTLYKNAYYHLAGELIFCLPALIVFA